MLHATWYVSILGVLVTLPDVTDEVCIFLHAFSAVILANVCCVCHSVPRCWRITAVACCIMYNAHLRRHTRSRHVSRFVTQGHSRAVSSCIIVRDAGVGFSNGTHNGMQPKAPAVPPCNKPTTTCCAAQVSYRAQPPEGQPTSCMHNHTF